MDLESKKDRARNIRHDMINLLDSVISESTRLKDRLEKSQEYDDFSSNSNTFGVAYGSLSGSVLAIIKNEVEYNLLAQQITEEAATKHEMCITNKWEMNRALNPNTI